MEDSLFNRVKKYRALHPQTTVDVEETPPPDLQPIPQQAALPQQMQERAVPEPDLAGTAPHVQQPDVQGPPDPNSQYYLRADDLERQAAPRPPASPNGWQQNLVAGIQSFGGALANPKGYQQLDFAKQQAAAGQEQDRQQSLLSRAKEMRGMGQYEQTQNRLIDQNTQERDYRDHQSNITEQHYNDEATHQRALEEQSAKTAQNEVKFAPAGSQPFKGGQPVGQPIPKEQTDTPHTVVTEKGVFQYNTKSSKYDIYVGPKPQSAGAGSGLATVTTVNDKGEKVTKFVPKQAGAEYKAGPTAQEENRSTQADIVNNYADHIMSLIDDAPDSVGPIAGRIAKGETIAGTVDPKSKALGTALASFVALQPILHGFRGGSQTVDHFTAALGDQHLNAAALKASVQEIKALAQQIRGGVEPPPAPTPGGGGWSVKVVK